jgi:hypothetical protein
MDKKIHCIKILTLDIVFQGFEIGIVKHVGVLITVLIIW